MPGRLSQRFSVPRQRPLRCRLSPLLLAAGLAVLATAACLDPAAREDAERPFLVVLGVAQDGGFPQAGCSKVCCRDAWANVSLRHRVASLGIVDPATNETWLLDATPDFADQLRHLKSHVPGSKDAPPTGIFLSHAHIGHYTGLMHLGKEVMGSHRVPVYTMPRLMQYLEASGPWSQLVSLNNIDLRPLQPDIPVRLNERLTVTAFQVPHRDEFSETVGFRIKGPGGTALYLPDIDKWESWERPLEEVLADVDVAYLDGTFFQDGEVPGRDMAEIPHPFMVETLARLEAQPRKVRDKVRFIHLNHTNPALQPESAALKVLADAGLAVAAEGETTGL